MHPERGLCLSTAVVVVTELCLVAQALQGSLCPVPSQTKHLLLSRVQSPWGGHSCVCPDLRALGGLQHRADPSNPWHWELPPRGPVAALGALLTPSRSLLRKASPGCCKGQWLKPSLPWQNPGELPQSFHLEVTGSDSARG